MAEVWTEERIRKEYIDARAEESQKREYKGADALDLTDVKKREISRDVSAMANASGGIIIYGIKEDKAKDQPGVPVELDPVIDPKVTQEWLARVINNIDPPMTDITIKPVRVGDGFVYVVEIPQSTTAHQASDFRYYRRYGIENKPMPDDQIRDVMNRSIHARLKVDLSFRYASEKQYYFIIRIYNEGPVAVHNLKFQFLFPDQDTIPMPWNRGQERAVAHEKKKKLTVWHGSGSPGISIGARPNPITKSFICKSTEILFPEDTLVFEGLGLLFTVDNEVWVNREYAHSPEDLPWVLYADNMPPQRGSLDYRDLINRVHTAN